MVWLPLYKLFIPGKLTPVSAKLQTHTPSVCLSTPLSLTHTHKHTQTHTSPNSNINFSFPRSCYVFKASEVTSRSNFQAKDTSSFAQKKSAFLQNKTVRIVEKGGRCSKSGNKSEKKTQLEAVHGCTPQDAGEDRSVGGT